MSLSCHVTSCHVTSCHMASCHVTSCHVTSCHVTSCHVTSCHVTSSRKKQGTNLQSVGVCLLTPVLYQHAQYCWLKLCATASSTCLIYIIIVVFSQILFLFPSGRLTVHPNICMMCLDIVNIHITIVIFPFFILKNMCVQTTINGVP